MTRRLWALAGAALVVVGVGGGLIGAALASPAPSAHMSGPTAASAACPVTSVADRVLPSVVTISAAGGGTGSGEVIRSDGYILTNNHVIGAAAHGGPVEVLFSDGTASPATIVGRDALTDLAVLKVQSARGLKAIELGSSESVRVGEPVAAIGAPLGLSGTVTSGIVSALDRTVQLPPGGTTPRTPRRMPDGKAKISDTQVPSEGDGSALLVSAVQTDAAINPGNSGGALVNCAGQLIGIPTAGATVPGPSGESSAGSIGLGFAIPVDVAKTISDQLIDSGRATHSFFGLETMPIPEAAAAQAGVTGGLYVASVVPAGPANRAGLRPGDVITHIESTPATGNVQLQELTLTRSPGDRVTLDYLRNAHPHSATITLAPQP